jgi:hypothetical protein
MIFGERERRRARKKNSLPPNQTISGDMCHINMKRI